MEILKQNANKAYILNVGQEAKDRLDLLDKVYGTHSRNFKKIYLRMV